ncbi:MAG: TFIIB-type zinc ribbon-containing protein [Candidatus Aenigmatarchaeota archaeon]
MEERKLIGSSYMQNVHDPSDSEHACPECHIKVIVRDYHNGEAVCGNCGLVVADNLMNMGAEWRAYTPEEMDERSRTGPPRRAMTDMGTTFQPGETKDPSELWKYQRLKRQDAHSKIRTADERSVRIANSEIERMCSILNAGWGLQEYAKTLYLQACHVEYVDKGKKRKGMLRGRSIDDLAAASIYAAYKMRRVPKKLDDVAEASKRGKKEIARTFRDMFWKMGMKAVVPDARLCVPKIAAAIGLPTQTEDLATTVLGKYRDMKKSAGKDPYGLAAASVYYSAKFVRERGGKTNGVDYRYTQEPIAEAAGVTSVTIRNRYKDIRGMIGSDMLEELYDDVLRFQ